MAFPENNYAPPGVYTQTNFESPVANAITTARIPVLIGEGSELLNQTNLAVVRGSSSTVDQQVVDENEAGRAVVSISPAGATTLGDFDGLITKFQVRNFPITNGDGTGTTSNSRNAVVVTFNGTPVVVQSVDGLRGIITLAQAPTSTDVVRCTYYFHRRDTLFTDNVSEQVTADNAVLYGAQGVTPTTGTYTVVAGVNDTFVVTVLGSANPTTISVTLPAGNLTANVIANTLTASVPNLTASTYINNFGKQALQLSAPSNLLIGNGTANGLLGFAANQQTSRNRVFYTFQGPIVDGSGGGITTTDPAKVVVKVNNVQVIPTAVDGSTRAVTLPYAPAPSSTVAITYYQNTWQDTFDYLANIGITEITQCGATPNRADYINEADYVLYNDTIVWGTALMVNSSTTAAGSSAFGPNQISGTLVDYKFYAAECTQVSTTQFQLPYQPTTGNGRNSPLGQSLFQTVSNDRIDLPTDRPDLVTAYWGYSLQDALERGPVTVVKVDSATSTITLASPVPVGASVYATFYYNLLVDKEYLLTVVLPGVGSVGTYTVADADGNSSYSATFDPNSKSAGLSGITLNFPFGSEYNAGARFQASSSSLFTGPVSEIVTVTLKSKAATPAAFSVYGSEPYYFVEAQSDVLGIDIDNLGLSEVNLATPNLVAGVAGILAKLVSDPIVYDDTTGGLSYTISASDNTVVAEVDGIQVTARAATGAAKTIQAFADALNEAADGRNGVFGAVGVTNTASNYVEISGAVAPGENITITIPVAAGGSGLPVTFTAVVAGPVANNEFTADAAPLTAAQNLALALNTNSTELAGVISATVDNTGVPNPRVYIHVQQWGTAGNSATLAEAGANMTVPVAAFSGGLDSPSEGTLDVNASEFDEHYTGWTLLVVTATDPATADGPTLNGQEYTIGSYNGTTKVFTLAGTTGWKGGPPSIATTFYLYNPATLVQVTGATKFTNGYTVAAAGDHDALTIRYDGAGLLANLTIPVATYATAATLAAAIQTALDATADFNGGASGPLVLPDFTKPQVNCTANAEGALVFTFRRRPTDTSGGWFQFVQQVVPLADFTVMAGLDADNANGTQAKYVAAQIARRHTIATSPLLYDRLVLSNRIYCGTGKYDAAAGDYGSMAADNVLSQCGLTILGGAGNAKAGLTTNQTADAAIKATIQPASLRVDFPSDKGQIGNLAGATDGEFKTVFFDGTGTDAANNVFQFTVDDVFVSVTFTASNVGVDTPLGDNTVAATSGTASVISQINAALAAIAGQPFGTLAQVQQSQMVRRDGVGLRITSRTPEANSGVVIGTGSANAALGFTANQTASRTTVTASQLVSALMNNNGVFLPAATPISGFADSGVAAVVTDADNLKYLYVESKTLGASSRIEFNAALPPPPSPPDALRQGTGLNVVAGTFVTGEAATNGFVVTSSNPNGSGSANTSVLNSGVGQDGSVGQTYVDDVTGFTFTLLPRDGGLAYPANQSFRFESSSTFVSDGSIPVQLPGAELIVTDNLGTAAGNVAMVSTFKRGGEEPAIGDLYYVSYNYSKQDFTPALYSRMATIEAVFGTLSPDNPVTLGAYLAILNGAVLVGIAQTQKAAGSDLATVQTYRDALDSLNTPLPGNIKPDIIVPLRGDSTEFFQYLSRNVSVQSSIRYQNERTAIVGMSAGTTPSQVQTLAQLLGNTRMRIVYPDTATLTLTNAIGQRQEYLVEGFYCAAAVAGNRASPNFDVATPWTNAQIVGFNQLGRKLDAVQQNQTAIRGVTILEDAPPFLRVRHGLTTDMTNILTKLPTIVQIADFVQQNARVVLANFIGIKFLPSVLSQIEGRLAMMFKNMVAAQIVNAYTGIKANVAPEDPTVANVEGYYQPVFPLLYIVITFNLRSTLSAQ